MIKKPSFLLFKDVFSLSLCHFSYVAFNRGSSSPKSDGMPEPESLSSFSFSSVSVRVLGRGLGLSVCRSCREWWR